MKEEFKIRKARSVDLKDIAEILMKESAKKPYNEKYTIRTATKEAKEFFQEEVYVALDKNEVIGFIASYITPDNKKKAYLRELWLKSSYQKKGIGKALVRFIENLYKKKGVKIIRLVAKKNADAFKFYKKIKYAEYKEIVFMEKKL